MPATETCGARLLRLIQTQAIDIAKREFKNHSRICLYNTGDYWVCFEHSAYFLSKMYPSSESFVINHPDYPIAIVGISISERKLQQCLQGKAARCLEAEYHEYSIDHSFTPADYGNWHSSKVKGMQ